MFKILGLFGFFLGTAQFSSILVSGGFSEKSLHILYLDFVQKSTYHQQYYIVHSSSISST